MKKTILLLLLAFVLTLALPFTAVASSPGKTLYLENIQIQQDKQMQFNFNRPLSGVIHLHINGETFQTLGFQNIKANLKYDMDVKNDKAFFVVDGSVDGSTPQEINLAFYIIGDTMIIPVESLNSIAKVNPQMEMPAENIKYVYTKLEGFSFAELQTIMDQSSKQEAAMELVKTIFEAIPDTCFTSQGNTAEMNIDKPSLVLIAKNFQDEKFIAELAEQMAALDPTIDKNEIVKNLTTVETDKDVSFLKVSQNLKIRKCKTQISPEKGIADWDFGYSDENMIMDCKLNSKSNIQSAQISSTVNMVISFKSPADEKNVTVKLTADSLTSQDKSTLKGNLNLTGNMEGMPVNLAADFNIDQQFKNKVNFTAPVLTADNSMDMDELEPDALNSPEPAAKAITVNVNDQYHIPFVNAPFIESDRILVPVRELGDSLGYEVNWNPPATVTMSTANKNIIMNIGQKQYTLNGQDKEMDSAPLIKGDVTYVPLRFIAEALGYEVSYHPETKEVFLNNQLVEK
ncbi:copper amine oxidase N-terminal domain-containing protein [Syntrophomonas erecta subsp. sporosyntropha]